MRRPVFHDLLLVSGLLLFPLISASDAASAESRVALVIGQSAYRAVPPLRNAENDGKRMAELLTTAGFNVTASPDLSQNEMRQTISDFAAKVAASGPDTVALVFYAGHGLQIDGENYLVPVDVDPKREADIPLQAVRLNDVLNTLASVPSKMRILMLDACRNNPFPGISNTAGGGLCDRRRQDRRARHVPFVLDLARRGRGRRHRRQQSLHIRAAVGGQGARVDRRHPQARARVREQGDRRAEDAVG